MDSERLAQIGVATSGTGAGFAKWLIASQPLLGAIATCVAILSGLAAALYYTKKVFFSKKGD